MTVDKIKNRTTTITFQSLPEMVRAFQSFAIGIRTQGTDVSYSWQDFDELDSRERRILEKLNQKITCRTFLRFKFSWNARAEIIERFELPLDTKIDFWHHWVEITTYNHTPSEHRELMARIYQPMKKMGFQIRHECETVVMNSNC